MTAAERAAARKAQAAKKVEPAKKTTKKPTKESSESESEEKTPHKRKAVANRTTGRSNVPQSSKQQAFLDAMKKSKK